MQGSRYDRRRFLKTLGSATAATGVSAVLLPVTTEEAKAYDPGQDERRARYKADAADVQAFYRTNGYETLKK
ncbi:MAG: formate dehydrogenase region target [Hyphomicrobiales bacterium]|nr:formate dehydrogenase region target [Hyphomicrobiales bacterium]